MKKLTKDQYVSVASSLHKNKYDYSQVVYTNQRSVIKIICPKHGMFEQLAGSHIRKCKDGSVVGCNLCGIESRSYTVFKFKQDLKNLPALYNYKYILKDDDSFLKHKDRVKVICPTHGEFLQIVHVILNGSICKLCSVEALKMKYNTFVQKATQKHSNRYSYVKESYNSNSDPMEVICTLHGSFFQSPQSHLSGSGCPKCWVMKYKVTPAQFVERSLNKHNNFYEYPDLSFNSVEYSILIKCPVHNLFKQRVSSHLRGSGCLECSREFSGWTRTTFKKSCIKNNNGFGIFYLIRCFNEDEEFYKAGITSRSVKQRFCNKQTMPYSYEIIQEIKDIPENVFNYEWFFKNQTSLNRYIPYIPFGGSLTECFLI